MWIHDGIKIEKTSFNTKIRAECHEHHNNNNNRCFLHKNIYDVHQSTTLKVLICLWLNHQTEMNNIFCKTALIDILWVQNSKAL